MNEPKIQQIGEPPRVDFETTSLNKQLTRKIRENILLGKWPAESRLEEDLIREYRARKAAARKEGQTLSVKKFLQQ
jgi:hypothetical protein